VYYWFQALTALDIQRVGLAMNMELKSGSDLDHGLEPMLRLFLGQKLALVPLLPQGRLLLLVITQITLFWLGHRLRLKKHYRHYFTT